MRDDDDAKEEVEKADVRVADADLGLPPRKDAARAQDLGDLEEAEEAEELGQAQRRPAPGVRNESDQLPRQDRQEVQGEPALEVHDGALLPLEADPAALIGPGAAKVGEEVNDEDEVDEPVNGEDHRPLLDVHQVQEVGQEGDLERRKYGRVGQEQQADRVQEVAEAAVWHNDEARVADDVGVGPAFLRLHDRPDPRRLRKVVAAGRRGEALARKDARARPLHELGRALHHRASGHLRQAPSLRVPPQAAVSSAPAAARLSRVKRVVDNVIDVHVPPRSRRRRRERRA